MKDHPLYRELPDSFEERNPPPEPAAAPPTRNWTLTSWSFLWIASTATALWTIVRQAADACREIGLPLASATSTLFSMSEFACAYPWVWIAAAVVVPWWMGRRTPRFVATVLPFVILMSVATFLWMVWALFLPVMGTRVMHLSTG